jgi:hypothetical protein
MENDSNGPGSWDPALWSIGTALGAAIIYLAVWPDQQGSKAMSDPKALREKAEMFQRRAETATDPISRLHYNEMAAHYRALAVEHFNARRDEPAH